MTVSTRVLFVTGLTACMFYALPAAANEAFPGTVAVSVVADTDMADMRGRAAPSSKVFIQTNNNNVPNNASQVQNGQPSSATASVITPNTQVTGKASVGNTSTNTTITSITPPSWYPPGYPTPPFTRPVGLSYSVKPPAPFTSNVLH